MKKLSVAAAAALFIAACGGSVAGPSASALTGDVTIDGSSTVYPITEAVAEEFQNANSGVQVTVAFTGTGGGFKKFCAGETDANDASRPIKTSDKPGADGIDGTADDELSEATICMNAGIEFVELKVAIDALAVVVSMENAFVDCLTTAELKSIWDLGSTVTTWADVRAGWPAENIDLYGPGADSGTFDYFTEVINGKVDQSRSDYTASEDDNTLVAGIAGSQYTLGYFGLAYVTENADKVRAVEIDGGKGCTAPSAEGANNGTYVPLGRPLFVYVSKPALARPEVAAFFRFFLENTNELSTSVGYIGLKDEDLIASKATLEAALK
jgi:phosphate transport system substrate-binding protein